MYYPARLNRSGTTSPAGPNDGIKQYVPSPAPPASAPGAPLVRRAAANPPGLVTACRPPGRRPASSSDVGNSARLAW